MPLDWELGDATGLELLERWQGDPELRWIPVLMLTGHKEKDRLSTALAKGATDYIRKPPEVVELDARLRNALRVRFPAGIAQLDEHGVHGAKGALKRADLALYEATEGGRDRALVAGSG